MSPEPQLPRTVAFLPASGKQLPKELISQMRTEWG